MNINHAAKKLTEDIKLSISELKNDFLDFKTFIKCNKSAIISIAFFLLLAYGIKLFYHSIMLDTSWIINDYYTLTNSWISFGRFGLVVIKKLFGLNPFLPYVACFLMICGMFIFSLTWSYLVHCFSFEKTEKSFITCIFPIIFLTAPLFAEQFNYILQGFEISFAISLCSLAAFCITKWVLSSSRILYLILGLFCMVWGFACYQAIVFLYVSAVLGCYILIYLSQQKGNITLPKNFFRLAVLKYAGTFITGFALSFIFNRLFRSMYGTSSYVNSMVQWGNIPVAENIQHIIDYVKQSVFGEGIFYSKIFFPVALLLGLYALVNLFSKRDHKILFLLAVVTFLASPFFLSVYLGWGLNYRMQFCYQFVLAFGFYILVWLIKSKKIQALGVALAFFIAFNQGYIVARLFTTEEMKYEQDVTLANKISQKIEELDLGEVPEYPVVLVGHHTSFVPNRLNGEVIGVSWFDYLGEAQRALDLFELLGYPYVAPTQEQIDTAKEIAERMEPWPNTDSVQFIENIIIVKLSD